MIDNIILIGLPGCGKTAIGKILAKKLNLDFIDLDEEIVKKAKKSIPEIFAKGEDVFRKMEHDVFAENIKKHKALISTGGGIVEKEENRKLLKNCSPVIYIDRPVSEILKDLEYGTRPLLKDDKNKIYNLKNRRDARYREFADIIVENVGNLEEVTEEIFEKVKKLKEMREF